ncbi:hypothetical protein BH11ACT3_BH11ACT3_09860 [soil metagenome]
MRHPYVVAVAAAGALVIGSLAGCVPSAETIDVDTVALSAGDVPDPGAGIYGSTVLDTFDDLALLLPAIAPLRDQVEATDQAYGTGLLADPVFGVAPEAAQGTGRADGIDTGAALAGGALVGLVGLGNGSDNVAGLGSGDSLTSDDGSMVVTRDENNTEISTQKTSTETDGELTVTSDYGVSVEGTICPDSNGDFDFTIKVRSESTGTGPSETASALQELEVHITGRLGSDAKPESITVDGLQNASEVNPAGDQVTVSSRQTYSGGAEAFVGLPTVAPQLVSKSDGATSDDVKRLAKRGGDRLASIAYSAILAAMALWEDGGCVRIVAPAPSGVAPHGSGTIPVRTEGKLAHDSFKADVDLALSGPDEIDKQKLTSEDKVTWVAGDAGTTATLTLKTASRRGGATLTVPLKPGGDAYTATGGGGEFKGTGTICDIDKPFTISGGGLTMEFSPTGPTNGTYSYNGSLGGFGVSGGDTYNVVYDGDIAVSIEAGGVGAINSGQSAYGTEHYDLAPLPSGC